MSRLHRRKQPCFSPLLPRNAIALNTEVVRAKIKAIKTLNLDGKLEDRLLTLGEQYHSIRMTQAVEGLFFYLVMEQDKSNLALARMQPPQIEQKLGL